MQHIMSSIQTCALCRQSFIQSYIQAQICTRLPIDSFLLPKLESIILDDTPIIRYNLIKLKFLQLYIL